MKKIAAALWLFLSGFAYVCSGGIVDKEIFNETIRIVDSLYAGRTGVCGARLQVKKITLTDGRLDFHFTHSIADYPVRNGDYSWLKKQLQSRLPSGYAGARVGRLLYCGKPISRLSTVEIGNSGSPDAGIKISDRGKRPIVKRGIAPGRGLYGRNIAIWQSHGNYYSHKDSLWKWQRSPLFQVSEDLFTQSFVVPFLAPMLENAGAGVFMPRERDWQKSEIIIDNDECESTSPRIHGTMNIPQGWTESSSGFKDYKPFYTDEDNPFLGGTFLVSKCTSNRKKSSEVLWNAEIPSRGEYAVYVTYCSLPESCANAIYTIHTLGGDVEVKVDQSIGGGTWIYLGTWEFGEGEQTPVSLSNFSGKGGVVVADAIKIGGGYGNISRCGKSSGRPRFAEGARYFMQWSGIPESVWSQNDGGNDYRDDLMSRGKWVQHLSGGSWLDPKGKGLGIPIDLSFAFHTDAGCRPGDETIGTLAIYTLKCDGKSAFPNKESRRTGRELADFVQSQIVRDIRAESDSLWQRRQLWDRSYSESRTTGVPGMLLELLSHQNFEDMKFGLDPSFRFLAARSCYKGILKYLAMRYNFSYVVQPLPPSCFSATLGKNDDGENCAVLKWQDREDRSEPTAKATSFLLYTRIDDGGWDNGRPVVTKKVNGYFSSRQTIEKGHIYSYRIVAVNDGGLSFPSETLAVGLSDKEPILTGTSTAMIVNNFTRISGPVWFDSPVWAGFENDVDSGVPYIRDWCFTGLQRNFNRLDTNNFGASSDEWADEVVGGNTFDYPFVHGKALLACGLDIESSSTEAFAEDTTLATTSRLIDVICGKQCQVRTASRTPSKDGIFPIALQERLKQCTGKGADIIISGCYIAHDVMGNVYPLDSADLHSPSRIKAKTFITDVLGYGLGGAYASDSGQVEFLTGACGSVRFPAKPCRESYCVESPDALSPIPGEHGVKSSFAFMRYGDTKKSAAIITDFGRYKVISFGFPLETISTQEDLEKVFRTSLTLP